MKPKYEVGQYVFFMRNEIIGGISVSVISEGRIVQEANNGFYIIQPINLSNHKLIMEGQLFTTKEEGIAMFEAMMNKVGL